MADANSLRLDDTAALTIVARTKQFRSTFVGRRGVELRRCVVWKSPAADLTNQLR